MWLFTRYGFYSIACARQVNGSVDPDALMIRARVAAHLRDLQRRFPALAGKEIVTLPDRDYRFRLIVPKEIWADTLAALAREQDWSNFKNEVAQFHGRDDYERALHEVWRVMYDLQSDQKETVDGPREWQDDPEPGDEDDPEYREEMFKSFEYGKVPPDHIRDKKMRADYVKWLEATGRKRKTK
jgi:hypothetical protein